MLTSSTTLSEWLDAWIEIYAPLRCSSKKTIERYRSLARYFSRTPELEALGETELHRLTHTALERALLSLLTLKGRERLSPRTVRHAASLFRVALKKAWVLDLIRTNPMAKVELPGFRLTEALSYGVDQVEVVRNAFRGHWTFALVELALATGCRRGELLALEWSDIDLESHTISISKSLEQTKAGVRKKSTKSGKPRIMTVPEIAIRALAEHRKTVPQAQLVFLDTNNAYRRPDSVSKVIMKRLRKAGLDAGTLHTLRHTHATHLLSRGVPITVISKRLGHASADITARIYLHALPLDDRRAADAWDEILSKKP